MTKLPLITSWADYSVAGARIIAGARRSLVIFDRDLCALRLEDAANIAALAAFLSLPESTALRIVVRDSEPLRYRQPRTLKLLQSFSHRLEIREAPEHLLRLSDSLLIADACNGLVRFHDDHARSREIVADAEACQPYCQRFNDVWAEGGTPVSLTTLGL